MGARVCCSSTPAEGQRYWQFQKEDALLKDALSSESLSYTNSALEQRWLRATLENGMRLMDAPDAVRENKAIVMVATSGRGGVASALHYASAGLRRDKEVVLKAVQKDPISIAYALGDIKRDPEIGSLTGLLSHAAVKGEGKILYFSGKFAPFDILVHLTLLRHPAFRNLSIYNPEFVWPKLQAPREEESDDEGQEDCLGPDDFHAYDAQWHLEVAKESGGFMLQVSETDKTGRPVLTEAQQEEQAIATVCEVRIFKLDQPLYWNVQETYAIEKKVEALSRQMSLFMR
jgi:hypothetical protein